MFHLRNCNRVTSNVAFIETYHNLEIKWHPNCVKCFRWRKPCASYSSSALSDEYQYLHKSSIPTMHFQPSLPRLPIPQLDNTCQRYLRSLRAVLTPEQLSRTENIVRKFRDGYGRELHEELVQQDKRNKHTSYISQYWSDMYLSDRHPIVLNFNPFMAFVDDPNPAQMDQLIRATNYVISAVRFKKALRDNVLAPEIFHLKPKKSDTAQFRLITRLLPSRLSWYGAYLFKAFPLDMSQFKNLFNSTRIPCKNKDEIYCNPAARHQLVIRNGHFYVFDVFDRNGDILPAAEIHACIQHIMQDNSPPPQHPIGYLSTEERDTWAGVREQLVANGNQDSLELLDTGLFALCLDDISTPDEISTPLARNFLYGDCANRWPDKSFMLMITKTGKTALNFEHAWGDGVAVMRFFNEACKDTMEKPQIHSSSVPAKIDTSARVKKLEFKLDASLKKAIMDARTRVENDCNSADLRLVPFHEVSKSYVKQYKLSPDSFIQLLLQIALYKQLGGTFPTYESCSTSAFRHGRTETMRPATTATKKMCEAFALKSRPSNAELRQMIDKCSRVHNQLVKEAAMGQGFDRHLFALHKLAEAHGKNVEIFEDESYSYNNHYKLSTSTLTTNFVEFGGFMPIHRDGYGVGYGIRDDRCGIVVASYPPAVDGAGFVDCVKETMKDLCSILEAVKQHQS